MATSGNYSTTNQYIVYWIEVIQNSQNIANNTSNVTVKVWIKRTNTGYTTYGSGTVYTNINGVQRNVGITPSQTITSTPRAIFHQDLTIEHNNDGTKTLNVQVGITHDMFNSSASSVSWNCTLTTIPRASSFTLSSSSVEAGSKLTLTISRAASSFTHHTHIIFGTEVFTIQNGVGTTDSANISMDTLHQIPNATSGIGTVYCDTYNGNTFIGTTSKGITINAPASVVPTFSSLDITRVDGVVPSSWGVYVKGKSKAKLAINGAAGAYSSTISKYNISGGGYSSTASSFTTGFLNTSGTITFSATITDSRGRTATKTTTCSVVDYSSPKITGLTAKRCNSDGTANDEGTYVQITPTYSYSSVSGKNSLTANIKYRQVGASSWSSATTISSSGTAIIIGANKISPNNSYEFMLTIQDAFETVTKTITVQTASTTLDFRQGGKGIAIGKVSERDGLEIDWETKFNKLVTVGNIINFNDNGLLSQITYDGASNDFLHNNFPIWSSLNCEITKDDIQTNIRFPNGIQINFMRYITGSTQFATAWGSIFASGQKMDLPNYNRVFVEVPTVLKSVEEGAGNNAWISSSNKATTTHPGGFELLRGTTATNSFVIQVISIGRWK